MPGSWNTTIRLTTFSVCVIAALVALGHGIALNGFGLYFFQGLLWGCWGASPYLGFALLSHWMRRNTVAAALVLVGILVSAVAGIGTFIEEMHLAFFSEYSGKISVGWGLVVVPIFQWAGVVLLAGVAWGVSMFAKQTEA